MNDTVNFYFDHSVFETMSKSYLYLNNNERQCFSCNRFIENISPVILFHNTCCYCKQDKYDTKLIESEIVFITYYLNHFNKKNILHHIDNINSLKHNYPDYIQEYLNSYILRINKQINNL